MTEPIRILFHVDSLCAGGLENKVTQLVLRLDRTRFEPVVSYSADWGINGGRLQSAGIATVQIVPRGARNHGIGKAVRQIRDLDPDVFHTLSCRQNAHDILIARRARVPVIISARGNVRHWAPPGPARNWEFDRNAMTHYVTANCQAVARLCREMEGLRQESIVVIPNGVPLPDPSDESSLREELGLHRGLMVAGYAATYRSLKAHETLLQSWRKVVDRLPEAHLVCCGEDDAGRLRQMEELVCRLSLCQHVTLLGVRESMGPFYRALDIYVHPSNSEGLSMAILEAMSYGLPVVATSVGGTPEIVEDGISGRLVAPSDPGAMAGAVLGLAEDSGRRSEMGVAGRNRVRRHFTIEDMVKGHESLYVRAAAERKDRNHEAMCYQAPETQFTGSPDSVELADTTVFVTTIGDEANFQQCIDHLRAQTVRCRLEIIDRVAPMSEAFALMHQRCTTPFYVQVDEDMLLYPETLQKLHEMIAQSPEDVAMACGALWDWDVERPILGIKIYRHAIVKQFPYENHISCEVHQLAKLQGAGYKTLIASVESDAVCLGDHGKHYTPQTIFVRWQRLFHKRNQLSNLAWLEPWPARLLERYLASRAPLHFYALLGALAGIAGRADPNHELDWRHQDPAWQRMQYYFPPPPDSQS